jgi:hypothetical protein
MKQKTYFKKEVYFMEKMTNVKALTYVKDNFTDMPADVAEKIDAMIVSLQKKSANRKPTKTQKENVAIKDTILEVLKDSENPMTVSEILMDSRIEQGITSQKVSALLKQMCEVDMTARKEIDKRKSVFSAVA